MLLQDKFHEMLNILSTGSYGNSRMQQRFGTLFCRDFSVFWIVRVLFSKNIFKMRFIADINIYVLSHQLTGNPIQNNK